MIFELGDKVFVKEQGKWVRASIDRTYWRPIDNTNMEKIYGVLTYKSRTKFACLESDLRLPIHLSEDNVFKEILDEI